MMSCSSYIRPISSFKAIDRPNISPLCIALRVPTFLLHQLQAEIMTQSSDDPTLPLKSQQMKQKSATFLKLPQAVFCPLPSAESYVSDSSNLLMHLFFVPLSKECKSIATNLIKECVSQPFQVYQSLSHRPMSITKALIFVIRVARIFFRVFKLPRGQVQEVLIESRQRAA
jgi:hypothetical protein